MSNCGMIAGAFSSTSGKADTVLTTSGDVLYYTSSRQRLPIGSEGTVLTVSGSDLPAWETASGLSSPLTSNLVVNDNINLLFGTGSDSSIFYDGTDMFLNPRAVGSGSALMSAGSFYFFKESNADISGGVISPTSNFVASGTEAGAGTDDLDTINAPKVRAGYTIWLQGNNSSRDITVKDGTGNLQIAGDFTFTTVADCMLLMLNNNTAEFLEVSRSNNG